MKTSSVIEKWCAMMCEGIVLTFKEIVIHFEKIIHE